MQKQRNHSEYSPIVQHVFHMVKDNPGITSPEIKDALKWVLPTTVMQSLQYLLQKKKIVANSRQYLHKYYIAVDNYRTLYERRYIDAKSLKIATRKNLSVELQSMLNRPFEQLTIKEAKKLSEQLSKLPAN